jgi:mono/diheme cytochrome c family protein
MKKIFKILGIVLLVALLAIIAFAAKINFSPIASYPIESHPFELKSDSAKIVRGHAIAMTLCNNCHKDGEGTLGGGEVKDAPIFGKIYAPNISHHPEKSKLQEYSDAELVYLLRTGIKRNGQYAPPYMVKLPLLSDNDMQALVSFLRSDHPLMAPSDKVQPISEPSFFAKFLCTVAIKPLPYPDAPIPDPDPNNKVELGQYVANGLASCFECHSANFSSNNTMEPSKSVGFYAGGNKLTDLEGKNVLSPNITMDEETGIGTWTEEAFMECVKSGIRKDKPATQYPMVPYTYLSDSEISAMWAYLQTVPKIKNEVKSE